MTDPLAYGEGLGGSVIILATFLGVVGLVQVAAHSRAACAEEVRAIEIPEHNQHDQLPSDHWYAGQKIMRDEIATLLEGGGE